MDLRIAIQTLDHRPATYVLRGAGRAYLYKGACRDLPLRLKAHAAGKVSRTKGRRPLELVYYEYFATYTEARRRENYFKTGAGRRFLSEKLMK